MNDVRQKIRKRPLSLSSPDAVFYIHKFGVFVQTLFVTASIVYLKKQSEKCNNHCVAPLIGGEVLLSTAPYHIIIAVLESTVWQYFLRLTLQRIFSLCFSTIVLTYLFTRPRFIVHSVSYSIHRRSLRA